MLATRLVALALSVPIASLGAQRSLYVQYGTELLGQLGILVRDAGDIDRDDKVMQVVQATVLDITRQLNAIKNIRERAYDNGSYTSQTVNSYNQLIESLLSLSQDMAQATSNPSSVRSGCPPHATIQPSSPSICSSRCSRTPKGSSSRSCSACRPRRPRSATRWRSCSIGSRAPRVKGLLPVAHS